MLFALMLCPFCFTMGAFVFSGILEPMAAALGVSVATAATLQSAYAIACAVCGPVLAWATSRRARKPLLLATMAAMTVLNMASAVTPDFASLFALRLATGGVGALAFPLAVAITAGAVPPAERATAIGAVYTGAPLAMILGVPAGSLLGTAYGWPSTFATTSLLCLATGLLLWRLAPSLDERQANTAPSRPALDRMTIGYLGVTLVAFTALFALVGLLGPVITTLTGLEGRGIAVLQFVSGLSGLAGVKLGARLAARRLRLGLPGAFLGMMLALAVVTPPLALGYSGGMATVAMVASVLIGPMALFAAAPMVQIRLAEVAGAAATVVFALNSSMVYLGQGLGVAAGAIALHIGGLAAAPATGMLLATPGLALALFLTRRGSAAPVVASP